MEPENTFALIMGAVLVLVGLWGFAQSPVLGVFPVNDLHNVVHLLTGALFIWAGFMRPVNAKLTNMWMGIAYLGVAILGFLGLLTFLNVGSGNDPDNYLHLAIGLLAFAFSFDYA